MVTDWQEDKVHYCERNGCPEFVGDIMDEEEVEAYLDEWLDEADSNHMEMLNQMLD